MKKSASHVNYLTFCNVAACIAVLMLHTNECFWTFSAEERYWRTANIIECIFYFAVPVFFMISGITLMDFYDRNSLKEYFLKRIRKTGIPFLCWSVIGLVWGLFRGYIPFSELSLKYIYQGITGTTIVTLYWFFTPLFIIYLSMPLFAAVEKSKRKTVFSYLAIAGVILNSLIPFVNTLFGSDLNTPLNIPAVSGALIWPVIGWLLHNFEFEKRQKSVIYMLSLAGLMMHLIGTYVLSMEAGEIISTYKGYQNIPCILYSAGVFVFLKETGKKIMNNPVLSGAVSKIGQYTFSIYLMQFIFLQITPSILGLDKTSLLYRLGAPVLMIPAMILITWCMRKVPVIRRIVP